MSYMTRITAIQPTAAPASWWLRFGLPVLLVFGLLVAFRLPLAWGEGRFQDEEATVFLAFAWHFPSEALFRPFGGYLNLAANASTLALATLIRSETLPLEYAPYFTMMVGLLSQLLPAILILNGRSPWLADLRVRLVALLILVLMPTTEEVFLNAMHVQFHLALAVGLIAALKAGDGRLRKVFEGSILFLAPLCGPAAIVFLPLFALRGLIERDRRRCWQFAILASGAAIQMLFFYHATPLRGVPFDPLNLAAAMFIRLPALLFSGVTGADFFGWAAAVGLIKGGPNLWVLGTLSVLVFAAIFVATLRVRDDAFWLLAAAVGVATVSLGFGIVTGAAFAPFFALAGPRYNYIPLVMLSLCFLCLATRADAAERRTPRMLVGLLLFVGVVHYFRPVDTYAEGPSWRKEVAAWRADPQHLLLVWPEWKADLSSRAIRCEQSFKPTDYIPRYCEQGWLTSFGAWFGPKLDAKN